MSGTAIADDLVNSASPVQGHVDAWAKFGTDRRLSGVEAFLPLSWNGSAMTFADFRLVGDDAENREFNAGFGARYVFSNKYIMGGYGFADRRRSSSGEMFFQGTAGAEILAEEWDVRLNGYLPLTGPQRKSYSVSAVSGPNIDFNGTGLQ